MTPRIRHRSRPRPRSRPRFAFASDFEDEDDDENDIILVAFLQGKPILPFQVQVGDGGLFDRKELCVMQKPGMSKELTMKSAKIAGIVLCAAGMLVASGCKPKSFVETSEPAWASTELRDDLTYDKAWASVVDTLVKHFDIEVLAKDDGYLRTSWLYTWTGKPQENYRVRVTAKFSPDHKICEVKSEAEYGGQGRWAVGYDTRLLSTLKTDFLGKIGRTTK